jgi:cobalt transporter subunit CbtB
MEAITIKSLTNSNHLITLFSASSIIRSLKQAYGSWREAFGIQRSERAGSSGIVRMFNYQQEDMTMQSQATTVATTGAASTATITKGIQLAIAFLLGAVIVYGAGFSQTSEVHNAAHDTRHSQGFPCH